MTRVEASMLACNDRDHSCKGPSSQRSFLCGSERIRTECAQTLMHCLVPSVTLRNRFKSSPESTDLCGIASHAVTLFLPPTVSSDILSANQMHKRNAAARHIQSCYKGYNCRRDLREERNQQFRAVVRLQAWTRGRVVRRFVQNMKNQAMVRVSGSEFSGARATGGAFYFVSY